jgi:hypothetical protein
MGYRGIQNGLLRFRGVRVPKENLLWGEGQGLKLAFLTLNTGRLTLPATNTAVAKQCLSIARRWAASRTQWGAPIGRHEAVASYLGWIASHVHAMEAVTDYATALVDRGGADVRIEAAMAKLFCSEAGMRIADLTLQIRGGRGYETPASLAARGEEPFPVERIFREARLNTIVEGTSVVLRLFLAREALDPHLARVGDLVADEAPFARRASAFGRAILHYPARYVASLVPAFGRPASLPPALGRDWARARRGAAALYRRIVRAMACHRASLEHRQTLLGRLVDDGVDLATTGLALARAASRGDAASADLASLYAAHARARIAARRALRASLDRRGARLAADVLEGRHRRLEEGILPHVPEPGAPTRDAPR